VGAGYVGILTIELHCVCPQVTNPLRRIRDREDPGRRPLRGRARSSFRFNDVMRTGYVGILTVELHFPDAGSLKGKRKHVKSAKAQLQNRFGASVAEVDHHDLWQRARLTVACVAREHRELQDLLEDAVRYLNGQEYELVSIEREVVVPGA
jgi:uncharacterized protein